MFDLQARYLYFPAVFSSALAAVTIYYGVGKLFKSRLLDDVSGIEQFKMKGFAIPFVFLLACYLTIMYSNYRFVSRAVLVAKKASELVESNVRDIRTLVGAEGGNYNLLLLLNFPCAVWGDLPFAPTFVWGPVFVNTKRVLTFYNALGDSVSGVSVRHIDFGTPYDAGRHYKYGVASSGELPATEFNSFANDKSNKILRFDKEKEKVCDISGKDYDSLKTFVSSF